MKTKRGFRFSVFGFQLLALACLAAFSRWSSGSIITVTPAVYAAAPIIDGAVTIGNPGDTINFAFNGATLALTTNPNGAAAIWATGRSYVGNGTTIALSGGVATTQNPETIRLAGSDAVTEFTGFVVTCAQIHCEGGAFNVHRNTFANGFRGMFVAGVSNSHFDGNWLLNERAEGIYGYPGNKNTYDGNLFDRVWEPIHLVAACDSTDISNNQITHATRIGIELQDGMTNLTVLNNYVGLFLPNPDAKGIDSHMGVSCATGGSGTAPYPGQGQNITIAGNTLVQDLQTFTQNKSGAEIMGGKGLLISKNIFWGWGNAILNGATGAGVSTSGNVAYGGNLFGTDSANWPIVAPTSTGDVLKPLATIAAPLPPLPIPPAVSLPPAMPAAATAPAVSPSPINGTAVANGLPGQIAVVCGATAAVSIRPTSLSASTPVKIGAGPLTIGTIPNGWQVTVSIDGADLPAVQVFGGPVTTVFAPALVTPAASVPTSTAPQTWISNDRGQTLIKQ